MPEPESTSRDTIRLPEHAIRSLIEALDRDAARRARLSGRPDQAGQGQLRFHDCKPIILEMTRPGEGAVRFLVVPRFLTADTITVIHGVFLHPHTRCVVHLRTIDGERTAIPGRLTHCAYAAARMHESIITFDDPIETAFYLPVIRPGMPAEGPASLVQPRPSAPPPAPAATSAVGPAPRSNDPPAPAPSGARSALDLARNLVNALQAEESPRTIAGLLDDLRVALSRPLPPIHTPADAPTADAAKDGDPPASAA